MGTCLSFTIEDTPPAAMASILQVDIMDTITTPVDHSPPSEHRDWPEGQELHSSSGDLSASPPVDYPWEDELARKLAAKLYFLGNKKEANENVVNQLNGYQNWGEDYVNQTYRTANPRFKTEICRNFKEKGNCLYGDLCQFAHGTHELRRDVVRHSKYKTKLCQKYWIAGYCAYGPRCNFILQEIEKDQALRILAGAATETLNGTGGISFKASNPFTMGYGDLLVKPPSTSSGSSSSSATAGRKGYLSGSVSDFDPDQIWAQRTSSATFRQQLSSFSSTGYPDYLGEKALIYNGSLSRSPVDLIDFCDQPGEDFNFRKNSTNSLAELLPSTFGMFSNEEDVFRRPIGSERWNISEARRSVWSSVWSAD